MYEKCNLEFAAAVDENLPLLISQSKPQVDKEANSKPKRNINYDDILEEIGEFGPWQIVTLLLLWLPVMSTGIFETTYAFTGLEPTNGFRCALPFEPANSTFISLDFNQSQLFPLNPDGNFDYCKPYKHIEDTTFDRSQSTPFKASICDKILFNDFEMDSTLVTDLGLVCDEQYKVALVGSIYMLGLFFGSFLFGFLADKIGRKKTLMISILTGNCGSLAGAFCTNYILHCITRFITALGDQGTFLTVFGLSIELVGSKRKTLVGNMTLVPYSIGECIFVLFALKFKQWWKLQVAVSLPLFLLLGLYFVLPESPRWLIAKGKFAEAKKTIEQAAKVNKVKLSPHLLEFDNNLGISGETLSSNMGFVDLFRNRHVRKITVIMFVNWAVITLGFFGINLSATHLGTGIFSSYFMTALVEIPSYIFCTQVMDRWGRKPIFVGSLFLTGISAIFAAFLAEGAVQTGMVLLGKFGASTSVCIVYLYTAELYPTSIRSTASGLCSMMARFGGIAAPQVAIFLPKIAPKFLPLVIMGSSCLVGSLLSILLPETLGSDLPETFEDVEKLCQKSQIADAQERFENGRKFKQSLVSPLNSTYQSI